MSEPIPTSIPITLLDGTVLEGKGPLVLVGANGVGKTRYGTGLVGRFGYDRVPALRSLSFENSIPYHKHEDAKRETENHINQAKSNPWMMSSELNWVLSELKAEDAQSAVEYRNKAISGAQPGLPEMTRLQKLTQLWKLTFPGREIDFSTYDPKVQWTLPGRTTEQYGANQMSDGERGALYLISRILRANPGVVIVDEPEVHFHALLARSFWDIVETQRPDCRFVYITHDIPFALSRGGARIGIVKGPEALELVAEDAPIPAELYEGVLGAASLSVVAKRVVFCEGKFDRSVDVHVYGAWFQSPDTVVVPVGSCTEVRQSVSVFAANPIIANANAIGIVERDYWPEDHLTKLQSEGLHVLPANEIEGLLALPSVAAAIAGHLGIQNSTALYADFETAVRNRYIGIELNKQILERAKREVDCKLVGLANAANPAADLAVTKSDFVAKINLTRAIPAVDDLFDGHQQHVSNALAGSASEFLKVLPGKACLALLCEKFGISRERYISLITQALSQPDTDGDPALETLRQNLIAALNPFLPSRI